MKYKQHTVSNPKYPPSLLAYPSTHSPSRPVPLNHSANLPKRRNIQTDKTTAKEQVNMLHFLLPFSLQLSRTAAKLRRISEQIMQTASSLLYRSLRYPIISSIQWQGKGKRRSFHLNSKSTGKSSAKGKHVKDEKYLYICIFQQNCKAPRG